MKINHLVFLVVILGVFVMIWLVLVSRNVSEFGKKAQMKQHRIDKIEQVNYPKMNRRRKMRQY